MARRLAGVFILVFALFVLFFGATEKAYAGPPAPLVATITQPDGVTFKAVTWGDEFSHGMETLDHHTILRDASSGYWVYAVRSSNGELVPATGQQGLLIVGRANSAQLPQSIRPNRPASADRSALRPSGVIRHNVGTQKVLVILAAFQNQGPVMTTPSYWSGAFFGSTGSVKAFFSQASFGQLTLAPAEETSGTANDGVVGWIYLQENHPNGTSDQYVYDAIVASSAYMNYASFDTNGDGYISTDELHIVVVAAGYEESYGGDIACTPNIWAHQSSLPSPPVVAGKIIGAASGNGAYATAGEMDCWTADSRTHPATIGQFAHEMGHDLGLPDLYDVANGTAGIGNWSIMATGSWNMTDGGYDGDSPALPDAWSKWYESWINPIQIRGSSASRAIPQAETNASAFLLGENPGGVSWWWNAHSGMNEYYLLENRQQAGFDVGLPGCGLLLWHIDESVTSSNYANADPNHRLVDLKQADGLCHLNIVSGGNRGDDGDPYPGWWNNQILDASSNPNSLLYSGQASGVSVTNISNCGSTMTADLAAPIPQWLYLPMVRR